ncbi:unnamed protein product, partial [Strongylus vulgaris]
VTFVLVLAARAQDVEFLPTAPQTGTLEPISGPSGLPVDWTGRTGEPVEWTRPTGQAIDFSEATGEPLGPSGEPGATGVTGGPVPTAKPRLPVDWTGRTGEPTEWTGPTGQPADFSGATGDPLGPSGEPGATGVTGEPVPTAEPTEGMCSNADVSDLFRKTVVEQHNALRSELAQGHVSNGKPQDPVVNMRRASKMMQLTYNCDLETKALKRAKEYKLSPTAPEGVSENVFVYKLAEGEIAYDVLAKRVCFL